MERRKFRILVVDDDHECRFLLSRFAAEAGYQVEAVADGAMALSMMQARPADLVLLDAHLPKQDGFSVCQAIRDNPNTAHTPVVMLTAFGTEDARERGLNAGADEFLEKPFRADQLQEIVDQLLLMHEARRTLDVDPDALARGLK